MIRYLWCIVRYLPCVDCIYKTSCVKHSRRAFRWYMDRCIQFFTKWFYWMIQFCITNVILIQGLMVYSANIIRSLFYLLKETLNYLSVFSWYFFFWFYEFLDFLVPHFLIFSLYFRMFLVHPFSYSSCNAGFSWCLLFWHSICFSGFSWYVLFLFFILFSGFSC